MFTLIAILHLLFCIGLIGFVLLQDPKGGGTAGVFSGAGANQLFGTTGAANLLTKITSWCAVLFGITCLTMTILSRQSTSSVIDTMALPVTPINATAPVNAPAAGAATGSTSAPTTSGANAGTTKAEAPKAVEKTDKK